MPTTLKTTTAFAGQVPDPLGPAWLRKRREEAWARFVERGAPGPKDEVWRTTDLRPVTSRPWMPAHAVSGPSRTTEAEATAAQATLPRTHRLVFVDGRLEAGLSDVDDVPKGLTLCAMSEMWDDPVLVRHLAAVEDGARHPFSDWNTAAFEDGAFVHVANGTAVERPIHLVFLSTAGPGAVHHARTLVVAGPTSQATVIEQSVGTPDAAGALTNAVTEIVAEDGAVLHHARLQQEHAEALHLAALRLHAGRDSTISSLNVQVGAAMARTTVDALLAEEGATIGLDGLFLAKSSQRTDTYTRIDHAVPHGTSRELYKGVLDGEARGAFTGNVLVRPGAQQTASEQENRNLLLSRKALVDSTPQLEIHADDVKCSHGSTVGQLDENALFFLRSRGLDAEQARLMLVQGFAREVTERAPAVLRGRLEETLAAWFGEGA